MVNIIYLKSIIIDKLIKHASKLFSKNFEMLTNSENTIVTKLVRLTRNREVIICVCCPLPFFISDKNHHSNGKAFVTRHHSMRFFAIESTSCHS